MDLNKESRCKYLLLLNNSLHKLNKNPIQKNMDDQNHWGTPYLHYVNIYIVGVGSQILDVANKNMKSQWKNMGSQGHFEATNM